MVYVSLSHRLNYLTIDLLSRISLVKVHFDALIWVIRPPSDEGASEKADETQPEVIEQVH